MTDFATTASRSRALLAGFVIAVSVLSTTLPAAAQVRSTDDQHVTRAETILPLTIVDQTFDLVPNTPLAITFDLPSSMIGVPFPADMTVEITSYGELVERASFARALAGNLGPSADTIDVSLDPLLADPNLAQPTPDTITVTVPTESSRRSARALQFADPGVHPVVVDIRSAGRVIAESTTFIHRLRINGTPTDQLSVGLLLGPTTTPEVAIDGSVVVNSDGLAEYARLADSLESIDAAATAAGVDTVPPRTVRVEPAILQAVHHQDPALARRLDSALARSAMVAMPRLPLDPSGAAAAQRDEQYTQLLRQGEDIVRELAPQTRVDRSMFIVDGAHTDAAITLRRDLGSRLLVMPFDTYTETTGNSGKLTDTTQLLTTMLDDGSSLPTAVIDPYLDHALDPGAVAPFQGAVNIVAELLVLGTGIERDGLVISSHGLVLANSTLGVPDAALLGNLTRLLLTTDGVRLVEVADFASTIDAWLVDGHPVELSLPATTDVDLVPRFTLIDQVAESIFAYASIVPDNDPRVARWGTVLDALPSTVVSDADAQLMASQLDKEFTDIRGCVVAPAPFSFTLTGRNNTFQFKMQNRCTTDVRVRLRLNSAKLAFPDGDQLVTLAANGDTTVQVRADALSNGKSSVFLRVYSPASDDVVVVPEVPLTARVNSLAGLGQLLTGAGLLLIVSWWAHNWRRSRRKLLTSRNVSRHPASNTVTGDLAPDAEASSLPPS
ncbi:MAG: hypothetical protein RLZZ623_479 [Actinomycetota bacterium]